MIAILGFKGGVGKTTITKLLGDYFENEEQEKTLILNLDFYQTKNKKIYSVDSINIKQNENIDLDKYNNYKNIIIDAGGFSDDRILELEDKIDKVILPTKIGELSLLELLPVLKTFKKKHNILIVVNDFVRLNKKTKDKTINIIKQMIEQLDIKHNIKLAFLKHYDTITNLEEYNKETKKGYSLIDRILKNNWCKSYKTIQKEINNLINEGVK